MKYQQYDLKEDAKLALNYIDGMTDRAYDYLPFWLTLPHKKPAEAEHCRVDDAELVGSWFEAVDSLIGILGSSDKSDELYDGFRRQVLSCWGEHGLRYHKKYPWTHTMHSSFHEMGYILPALNRMVRNDPNDTEAEKRASELVRGMRSLVIERKVKTFWSGDSYEKKPIYEFPNDVYLMDGGFDLSRHTGRGEQAIRNAVMLHALVDRFVIANDDTALDLARGIANYLLGPSRYFNYKYEYFGHVHSACWVAAGLIYLGRVTGEESYLNAGERIYKYTRSLTSSFGWVPEYAQWMDQSEEHCETCCIKDMILCSYELILCGKSEYWDDLNRFGRNQLSENQIKYTGYVTVDNTLPDKDGKTYHDLDKRLLGGYTGGSEPNSISLTRFRSIAGCCVGTGPIALGILWDNIVTDENGVLIVNIHTKKETEAWSLCDEMPDNGNIRFEARTAMNAGFRLYDWMGSEWSLLLNGKPAEICMNEDTVYVKNLNVGDILELVFSMQTVEKKEFFAGREYTEFWRGGDMIELLPKGEHIRLYQRDLTKPKYYPSPEDIEFTGAPNKGPSQQKHQK
ncbi:MAG: hypothetical protein E7670_01895 [Ruminococcaceae bacterium]|nr:hypothetical protein [Oscillospiraceae bacterium]